MAVLVPDSRGVDWASGCPIGPFGLSMNGAAMWQKLGTVAIELILWVLMLCLVSL